MAAASNPARLMGIAACALLAGMEALHADEATNPPRGWQMDVKGSEQASWESNPLMLVRGASALYGSVTTPELIVHDDTPTSHFSLDTSVAENLYDHSAFDSTDFHEKLALSDQNERWLAEMKGQVDYDTTRTGEFTTFGLDLPNVRRFGLAASPQISFQSTPIDKFSIGSTLSNYSYNNAAFVDYDFLSISPSYTRNLSPTDSASITWEADRYTAQQGPGNTIDSFGPLIGWQSLITPLFTSNLTIGAEKSTQSSAIVTSKPTNFNYVFRGNLNYKDQLDTANFIASRAHQPFANGTETLLTAFTANDSHAINEKLSLTAAATYEFAQYGRVIGINFDNEYNATVGMAYRVLETADLTVNYRYTQESLTNVGSTIRDNAILVGLAYHPMLKIL